MRGKTMASPIQLLKQGIDDGNWEKIVEAYTGLTGEKIELVDTTEEVVLNQNKTLLSAIDDAINILSPYVGTGVSTSDKPPAPVVRPTHRVAGKQKKSKKAVKKATSIVAQKKKTDGAATNKDGIISGRLVVYQGDEVDVSPTMAEGGKRRMQFITLPSNKKEREMDEKMYKYDPVARREPSANMVEVECTECERVININSIHVASIKDYICDKCRGRSRRKR